MQRQATANFFSAAGKHMRKKRARLKNFCINTDHLGNTRVSFQDADGNGAIDLDNEVVETNDYYPFGLEQQKPNTTIGSTNLGQKFKYNGKEMVDDIGLDWYDFGARNYSPELGRWMNLDPLAEQMRRHSPYNYAFDNPIYFIDPDGMKPCPKGDCDTPKDKKIQFFNKPKEKPVGKIFSASASVRGKIGPSLSVKASAGKAKANVDVSLVKGKATLSDSGVTVQGDVGTVSVGFGVEGLGSSEVSGSVAQLKGTVGDGKYSGEASVGIGSAKATVKGATIAEKGSLASTNEEINGKTQASGKAQSGSFSGTFKGNKIGIGVGVGPGYGSVSVDLDEIKNAASNLVNKVLDFVANGVNEETVKKW